MGKYMYKRETLTLHPPHRSDKSNHPRQQTNSAPKNSVNYVSSIN